MYLNIDQSPEAAELLKKNVSKGLRVDILQNDLNNGAKIRIKEIRRFYGVSRTTCANLLGTSYRQYLRYEEGSSALPAWVIEALAMFFNLSLDFFSGISDDPKALYQGEYMGVNGYFLPECMNDESED